MISILALGDSYTIGEGVSIEETWPMQLTKALRRSGLEVLNPTIIAKTGWTTGELLTAIKEANNREKFDYVFLLIGVNNQYRSYATNEYKDEFEQLLSIAINYSKTGNSNVYVLSIPDWGNTPFAEGRDNIKIASEIDAFNKLNKEESVLVKAHYVNVTEMTRQKPLPIDWLVADGLHPSGKMYRLWVEEILNRMGQIN